MKDVIIITALAIINSIVSIIFSAIIQMGLPELDLMNLHVFLRVVLWLVPVLISYIFIFTFHRMTVEYAKLKSLSINGYVIVLILSICFIIPLVMGFTGSLNSEFTTTLLYVVSLSALFIKIYKYLIEKVIKIK